MGVGMNNAAACSLERFCWSSAWTRVSSSSVELASLLTLRWGAMERQGQAQGETAALGF